MLDDLFGENKSKPANYWNEESVRQFVKDNNIKTRSEFKTKAGGAYDAARQYGLLNDLFGENKTKPSNYWTEETIRRFVKDNDIKTRKELRTKASGAYNVA